MPYAKHLILTCLGAVYGEQALAQALKDLYPPKFSDSEKAQLNKEAVKSYEIYVNGLHSRLFQTNQGLIQVPYQAPIDSAVFRSEAKCLQDNTAVLAEAKAIPMKDFAVFATVIAETVIDRCQTGEAKPAKTDVNLDIGVSKKQPGRRPAEVKIFNRNLMPNLFIERDF